MKKIFFSLILCLLCFAKAASAQSDKWEVFKSTHFFLYYKNATQDSLKQISDKCEEYYNRIAEELGFSRLDFWLWDDRAKVYIYDDAKSFRAATNQPAWSQGFAIPGYKIIQTFIGAEYFLETTLAHEMSHIIFREFVGFNNPAIPLWLDEGVASYQERNKFASADRLIREARVNKTFMDLGQLSRFHAQAQNSQDATVELFYLESFSLVNFLFEKFGKEGFVSFCRNLRDKRDLSGALSASYHFAGLKELDQVWVKYIGNE